MDPLPLDIWSIIATKTSYSKLLAECNREFHDELPARILTLTCDAIPPKLSLYVNLLELTFNSVTMLDDERSKVIGELSQLQTLRILAGNRTTSYTCYLPKSVTVLELCYAGKLKLVEPLHVGLKQVNILCSDVSPQLNVPNTVQLLYAPNHVVNSADDLPSMRILGVASIICPPVFANIKVLTLELMVTLKNFAIFPRTLESLSIKCHTLTTIEHLPPNLRVLSVRSNMLCGVDSPLPSTLTHLIHGTLHIKWDQIPVGMVELNATEIFGQSVPYLPALKQLRVSYMSEYADLEGKFPSMIDFGCSNPKIKYFPPTLTALYTRTVTQEVLDKLPDLVDIMCWEWKDAVIPPYITHFRVDGLCSKSMGNHITNGMIPKFPPSIVHLDMNSESLSDIVEGLPPNLTYLRVGRADVPNFKHPMLRELCCLGPYEQIEKLNPNLVVTRP